MRKSYINTYYFLYPKYLSDLNILMLKYKIHTYFIVNNLKYIYHQCMCRQRKLEAREPRLWFLVLSSFLSFAISVSIWAIFLSFCSVTISNWVIFPLSTSIVQSFVSTLDWNVRLFFTSDWLVISKSIPGRTENENLCLRFSN